MLSSSARRHPGTPVLSQHQTRAESRTVQGSPPPMYGIPLGPGMLFLGVFISSSMPDFCRHQASNVGSGKPVTVHAAPALDKTWRKHSWSCPDQYAVQRTPHEYVRNVSAILAASVLIFPSCVRMPFNTVKEPRHQPFQTRADMFSLGLDLQVFELSEYCMKNAQIF